MIKIGNVSKLELDLVNRTVMHCEPAEHLAMGVLLTTQNGMRVWQVGARTVNMTVIGQDADFEGSYIIFGRFIQAAYLQCGHSEACVITIENEEISASTAAGTTTMLVGSKTYPLRKFNEPSEVTALIAISEYNRIFGSITSLPTGFFDSDTLFEAPFSAIITVTDGKVNVKSRWPKLKLPEISMSCEAKTTGEGKIVLPNQAIGYMSLCIYPDGVKHIEISFAAKDPSYARFKSGPVTVVVEKTDTLPTQLFNLYTKYLEDNNFEFQVGPDGVLVVNYENTLIRVQLFDGTPSIARCTKVILVGVKSSLELLEEINAMNVGRAINRIWLDNDMVVIGSDLIVYNDMNSLHHTIERLKHDSDDLEVIFSKVSEQKSKTDTKRETK